MKNTETPFFTGYSGMNRGWMDYEAFYDVTPTMVYWGSHCHDFYEFYIHFHGGTQMVFDNQLYDLAPYQLFIFPPFSMHGLVCRDPARDYARAYLNCTLETLKRAGCGRIDLDRAFRTAVAEKGNLFILGKEEAEQCREDIKAIAATRDDHSPERDFEHYSLILAILNRVLKAVGNKEAEPPSPSVPSSVQRIISYINEHYQEPIRLRDISDHFNISQSALSHDFVRYTNRGVYDYILYRRVMRARELILSGEALGDISEQCGFADYSNFLRMFRKHVGMSPRAYREAHRSPARPVPEEP